MTYEEQSKFNAFLVHLMLMAKLPPNYWRPDFSLFNPQAIMGIRSEVLDEDFE